MWLKPRIYDASLPAGAASRVVVLGSVATKCAWLMVRRGDTQRVPACPGSGTVTVQGLRQIISRINAIAPAQWGPERAKMMQGQSAKRRLGTRDQRCHGLLLLLLRMRAGQFTVTHIAQGMGWHGVLPLNFGKTTPPIRGIVLTLGPTVWSRFKREAFRYRADGLHF